MKKTRSILVLWILLSVVTAVAGPETTTIKTPHLAITYPAELAQSALSIAADAEDYLKKIINYFEYTPRERINFIIINPVNGDSISDKAADLCDPFTVIINPGKIGGPEHYIYPEIYSIYMKSFTNYYGIKNSLYAKNETAIILASLEDYILYGIDDETIVVINDYLINMNNHDLDIENILYKKNSASDCLAKFFIRFIEKNYGKRLLLQAIKDSSYYGSFTKSLSKITGQEVKQIVAEYNRFLLSYTKRQVLEDYFFLFNKKNEYEFNIVSQCYNNNNDSVLLLSEKKEDFYIIEVFRDRGTVSVQSVPGNCFEYTSITMNNEGIILAGKGRDKSLLALYDSKNRDFIWQREFPFIAINGISANEKSSTIYVAASSFGIDNIFSYDASGIKVIKSGDPGVRLVYPYLNTSGFLLYIMYKNDWSIMRHKIASGESTEIYRSQSRLESPSEQDDTIIFSESEKGAVNIFAIENQTGLKKQLTFTVTENIAPLKLNNRLYFLNYYKEKLRPVFLDLSSK